MKFGIDRLIAEPVLRTPLNGRRVALLAHPASVTEDLTHSLDALAACDDMKISRCFRSAAWSARRQARQHDRVAGLQRSGSWHSGFSLYGEVRKPTDAMMDTFDVILVDLQDLGCRIYTFITTLRYVLEAARNIGKRCGCWIGPILLAGRGRLDAATRLAKLCRRWTVADASWAHARRIGSVVYQNAQARCRVSHHRDARLAARCRAGIRLAAWRAHLDQSQSQRAEFMDGARLRGHGDARGHNALGRAWHHAAARSVRRSRYRCAGGHEGNAVLCAAVATTAAACAIAGSNRRFTSMWASFATACRFTQKIRATITSVQALANPALAFKAIRRLYPDYPLWRDFAYEYEHGKPAIDVINGGPLLREWVDDVAATPQDLDALAVPDEQAWSSEQQGQLAIAFG